MNFVNFQKKLNTDHSFKAAFLRDPEASLDSAGVSISEKNAAELREDIDSVVSTQNDDAVAKAEATVLLKLTIKF